MKVIVDLHDELSFQLRLQQLDSQHRLRHETLKQWLQAQSAALPDIKAVSTSGEARNALKQLESFSKVRCFE
jgi:hypothetical protein